MPKVGGKHYPYTPKGIAMAKNKAMKEGKKVDYSKKKSTKKVTKKPMRKSKR